MIDPVEVQIADLLLAKQRITFRTVWLSEGVRMKILGIPGILIQSQLSSQMFFWKSAMVFPQM